MVQYGDVSNGYGPVCVPAAIGYVRSHLLHGDVEKFALGDMDRGPGSVCTPYHLSKSHPYLENQVEEEYLYFTN